MPLRFFPGAFLAVAFFTGDFLTGALAFELTLGTVFFLTTGSFFLTGELRTKWMSEEKILKNRSNF